MQASHLWNKPLTAQCTLGHESPQMHSMRRRRWREPAPAEGCGKTAISSSIDGFCLISSLESSPYQHRCHFKSRFYMDELRWLTSGMKDPLKCNLWAFFSPPSTRKNETLQNNLEQVWGLQSCKSNSSAWALKDRLSLPNGSWSE